MTPSSSIGAAGQVGGGLTYHVNPKLDGSGVVGGLDVKFKDALGAVLEADYGLTERASLGLRYTSLKYEVEGASVSAKSDGVGLVLSVVF